MTKIVRTKWITPDEIDITFECPFCGELTSIAVSVDEINDWIINKKHVQDAFKSLGLLMKGNCL